MTATHANSALIIGASRGLGYALAAEYLARDWTVTATTRGSARTDLHALAESSGSRLLAQAVDITVPEQVEALHERLTQTRFDLLLVNAGTTNDPEETVATVSTETFVRLMVTNPLSPTRVGGDTAGPRRGRRHHQRDVLRPGQRREQRPGWLRDLPGQ